MGSVLDDVFTDDVLARLRSKRNQSAALQDRIAILDAREDPGARLSERSWQRTLLAQRAAWARYVDAMHAAGMLDDDMVARLRGEDDNGFRSALSECLTCHLLSRVLRLAVLGRGDGQPGKVPDLRVRHADADITIEVKSPFAEKPDSGGFFGDPIHLLTSAVDTANKQFAKGHANVLALVPFVHPIVFNGREPFVRALLGESTISYTLDKTTGTVIDGPTWKFAPNGKLLYLWKDKTLNSKNPRFTRVGAVLVVREVLHEERHCQEDFAARVELRWFVLHNPYGVIPVPSDLWGECAQLVCERDEIRWTDGWSLDGTHPPASDRPARLPEA
jgi:hypothetical protein